MSWSVACNDGGNGHAPVATSNNLTTRRQVGDWLNVGPKIFLRLEVVLRIWFIMNHSDLGVLIWLDGKYTDQKNMIEVPPLSFRLLALLFPQTNLRNRLISSSSSDIQLGHGCERQKLGNRNVDVATMLEPCHGRTFWLKQTCRYKGTRVFEKNEIHTNSQTKAVKFECIAPYSNSNHAFFVGFRRTTISWGGEHLGHVQDASSHTPENWKWNGWPTGKMCSYILLYSFLVYMVVFHIHLESIGLFSRCPTHNSELDLLLRLDRLHLCSFKKLIPRSNPPTAPGNCNSNETATTRQQLRSCDFKPNLSNQRVDRRYGFESGRFGEKGPSQHFFRPQQLVQWAKLFWDFERPTSDGESWSLTTWYLFNLFRLQDDAGG